MRSGLILELAQEWHCLRSADVTSAVLVGFTFAMALLSYRLRQYRLLISSFDVYLFL